MVKKLNNGVKIKKERIDEACTATSFAPIFNNHKGSDSNDPITVDSHTIDPTNHKIDSENDSVKLPNYIPKVHSTARASTKRSGRAK